MSKAWRESTSVDSQAEFQLHWLHCVCSCGMTYRHVERPEFNISCSSSMALHIIFKAGSLTESGAH